MASRPDHVEPRQTFSRDQQQAHSDPRASARSVGAGVLSVPEPALSAGGVPGGSTSSVTVALPVTTGAVVLETEDRGEGKDFDLVFERAR